MRSSRYLLGFALTILVFGVSSIAGAAVFIGPSPYLSAADIPGGFYSGPPTHIEDFEDLTFDGGVFGAGGTIIDGTVISNVDSVDADDGSIDGSGSTGSSYFAPAPLISPGVYGSPTLTFTFTGLPTAVAFVWTDGFNGMFYDVLGPGGSVVDTSPVYTGFADGSFSGTTAEDRFFGVLDAGGIFGIVVHGGPAAGIEVDHVQYGAMVPEPGSIAIFSAFAAVGLFTQWRRRRAA